MRARGVCYIMCIMYVHMHICVMLNYINTQTHTHTLPPSREERCSGGGVRASVLWDLHVYPRAVCVCVCAVGSTGVSPGCVCVCVARGELHFNKSETGLRSKGKKNLSILSDSLTHTLHTYTHTYTHIKVPSHTLLLSSFAFAISGVVLVQ